MSNSRRASGNRGNAASRARAAAHTPVRDEQPEPDVAPEVRAQEAEADRYIGASLCGELVRIIPPLAWRQSWQRLLNQGQTDAFAELTIHPDDLDSYLELDPTNEEFAQFIADAAELSGESLGKSRGPAASSRRTRNR